MMSPRSTGEETSDGEAQAAHHENVLLAWPATLLERLAETMHNLTCTSIPGADHAYTHQHDSVWGGVCQWLEKISEGREQKGLREKWRSGTVHSVMRSHVDVVLK